MTGQIVMGTPAIRRYATIGQGGRRGWWMPPLKGGGVRASPSAVMCVQSRRRYWWPVPDTIATTELSLKTVARVHDITTMFHAFVYFASEAAEEYAALGVRGPHDGRLLRSNRSTCPEGLAAARRSIVGEEQPDRVDDGSSTRPLRQPFEQQVEALVGEWEGYGLRAGEVAESEREVIVKAARRLGFNKKEAVELVEALDVEAAGEAV